MSNSEPSSQRAHELPSDDVSIAERAERAAAIEAEPLTPVEARVLGCLIEKESTTPDSYPLTLNSLRLACNQATSRDPVVDYDEHTIDQALVSLRTRGLTRTVHSTSNRAAKFRHVLPEAIGLQPDQTAVLAVLLLRGAQTIGEVKGRTGRLYEFDSTDQVALVLEGLAERHLVQQLDRQPGQKDARWVQLLTGPADAAVLAGSAKAHASPRSNAADAEHSNSDLTYEFEAAFVHAAWDDWMVDAVDAFDGIDLSAGPLVNVSAGVGGSIDRLVELVPGSAIVAVEPSPAKRTALLARLVSHPEWLVTVEPVRLADAQLPERAAAVLALDVLANGTPADIARLWDFLANNLAPGGAALIATAPATLPRRVQVAGLDVERVDDRYRVRRVADADTGPILFEASAPPRAAAVDPDGAELEAVSRGLRVERRGTFLIVHR